MWSRRYPGYPRSGGSVVVVIRSANLNRCIRPAGDQSTRVVERILCLQSQRTILSDETTVVVIDILPGKLDAFLADHSTRLLRHAEVQTICITEAIAIAVFNITERVYLQFLLATISAVLLLTPDIDSIVMFCPIMKPPWLSTELANREISPSSELITPMLLVRLPPTATSMPCLPLIPGIVT